MQYLNNLREKLSLPGRPSRPSPRKLYQALAGRTAASYASLRRVQIPRPNLVFVGFAERIPAMIRGRRGRRSLRGEIMRRSLLATLIIMILFMLATMLIVSLPAGAGESAQFATHYALAQDEVGSTQFMPLVRKDLSVHINQVVLSPSSPANADVGQNHHIYVGVAFNTNTPGALHAALYEGQSFKDDDTCHPITQSGTFYELFGLDVIENTELNATREYRVEARFKPGAATCGENGLYPDVVYNEPYKINWHFNTCPPVSTDSGYLRNGAFEGGWTDLTASIQKANEWDISWIPPGGTLYDDQQIALADPEFTHKNESQLPDNEKRCGSTPLILDGQFVYKIFNPAAFGGELKQIITGLPPGQSIRLTVPILGINELDGDPYGSAAGVWINGVGRWVWAYELGNRTWYNHVIDITVPGNGQVTVLIRVKAKWGHVDFFLDALRLWPN